MNTSSLRIACIGAGTIGRAWIVAFARSGAHVRIFDKDKDVASVALDRVEAQLRALEQAGLLADAGGVLARVQLSSTLQDALANVDYMQESVVEDRDVKAALFREMDRLAAPETLLASSTSEFSGSTFMVDDLSHPGRCLVAHPINPPSCIPLVELVGTPATLPETMGRARDVMTAISQVPIVLNREVPGFVANRLQAAVLQEAFALVADDICSPSDIDLALKAGLARRWVLLGPFEAAHLNSGGGFGDYMTKYGGTWRSLFQQLSSLEGPPPDVVRHIHGLCLEQVPEDCIPEAQARRDDRLALLASHLSENR